MVMIEIEMDVYLKKKQAIGETFNKQLRNESYESK